MERIERLSPRWTIERVNRLLHHDKGDLAEAPAAVPALAASMRASLARGIERATAAP